jgi:kumamolisin
VADDQQDDPSLIQGPLPRMLDDSTELGPARGHVELTVSLKVSTRPDALIDWGTEHGLAVKWRDGDSWAYVDGPAADVASAFGVEINDYRGADDTVFYASRQEPPMPAPLHDEVSEIGRIIGDIPLRRA